MPAQADRDVELAVAPGASEAVGDQHRRRLAPVSSRRRARMRRAEASGSRGSSTSVSGSDALEASTPGVRAHEAVAGAADEHAALGAQDLDGLDRARPGQRAGSRPGSTASSSARAPGVYIGERHDRALGLGDGLVGDHDQLAVQQACAVERRDDQRRQVVAGAHLGQAAEGTGGQARHGARAVSRARDGRDARAFALAEHRARARGPRGGRPTAARAAPAGRRRCRCRAAATRAARRRQAAPAASASARWRSQLSGPKLGAIASGGVSSRPLVPVPWRSGTITTSG